MSKALFEAYREEEINSMVDMPYEVYLNHVKPLIDLGDSEVRLLKHHIPSIRDQFKKNPEWAALEQTIKECRAEQKEIESQIRVDETRGSLT